MSNKNKLIPKYFFALPVWGERHTNTYLEIALPSQIEKNLELIEKDILKNSRYVIYTHSNQLKVIKSHKNYKALIKLIDVKFVLIDKFFKGNKWKVLIRTQRKAVAQATRLKSYIYFILPDQLWTNESLYKASEKIKEGFKAIMCPGIRLNLEDVESHYKQDRNILNYFYKCLHAHTKSWFIDSENPELFPSYLLLSVEERCFIGSCYILHPVVVSTEEKIVDFSIFDQDYLEKSIKNFSDIYISKSTQDICHFELSPSQAELPTISGDFSISLFTQYAEWHFNNLHRKFAKKIFTFGVANDEALLNARTQQLKAITNNVLSNLKRSDLRLLIEDTPSLFTRLLRKYRHTKKLYALNAAWLRDKSFPAKILKSGIKTLIWRDRLKAYALYKIFHYKKWLDEKWIE